MGERKRRPLQKDAFILQSDHKIWDDLPTLNSRFLWLKNTRQVGLSSILAMAILPIDASNIQSSKVVACSVDARWTASEAYFEPKNSTSVSSNVTDPLLPSLRAGGRRTGEPVTYYKE
ncbi:hypothetical protein BU23DRAFT_23057 [Bimuria novae-zelandiae CBS 107.79]|uniref:Uncharacterized protein n=1 Tax=Bimuria novae-zelandiae CBS 107.79 TaxID=1447943 RepID=A0A6A5UP14_9PLEO|nr:hypothetical protein BU23DRAFT_23057 [Bimuria novae-zelandiae CBS 107.79]